MLVENNSQTNDIAGSKVIEKLKNKQGPDLHHLGVSPVYASNFNTPEDEAGGSLRI